MEHLGKYDFHKLAIGVFISLYVLFFVSCGKPLDVDGYQTLAKPQFTDSNTGPYLVQIDHLELIDSLRQTDPVLDSSFISLILGADSLLNVTFKYVPDNLHLPPSGDPHDYMSLHKYSYPDSEGNYTIIKDGQTNPEFYEYDKPKLEKISAAVYTLSLAYHYTKNEKYAEKASKEIKNFFLNPETLMNPNMNYASIRPGVSEGSGPGIVGALDFIDVIEATGLLYSSQHWPPDLHYQLKEWFHEFYRWMRNNYGPGSYGGTNVSTWMDVQRAVFLLFIELGEEINSQSHIPSVSERLNAQIDSNGLQPYESKRGISQHYTYFNLKAYMYLSIIRKNQFNRIGHDRDWEILKNCALEDCSDGGLKLALENIAQFLKNAKKETALFASNPDFNTCRYLEIFRPAAVAYESFEYEGITQLLIDEGCSNPNILLTYPSLLDF